MKKWTLLIACLCGISVICGPLIAHPSSPDAPTPEADAAIMLVVEKAIRQTDVPTLADLYQTSSDPVTHVLAAMALERIHFNLDKSSEDARLCERGLIDSNPQVAFFCAKFANGNERLSRGANRANADELDILQRFAGRLPKAQLDQLKSFAAEHAKDPEFQVIMPPHSFSIPVTRSLARGKLPSIEVESGGKKTWLLIDTGSSVLMLDETTARELGVSMSALTGKTNGFLSHGIPIRYGTLPKLTIGELTLLNVPVQVTAADHRLLGIDILRRLGEFRLGEKALVVGEGSNAAETCKEPMLISSDIWGNGLRVVAALSIDGSPRMTLLDSGTDHYLAADQHALEELHSSPAARVTIRDISAHQRAARVSQAVADVNISGQPFTVTLDVFKDASLPWHYILGSAALNYMDFYLNFNTRHTCLLLHHDLH